MRSAELGRAFSLKRKSESSVRGTTTSSTGCQPSLAGKPVKTVSCDDIENCSQILTFSAFNDQLLAEGFEDSDKALLLTLFHDILHSINNILEVLRLGQVDVLLHFTLLSHESEGASILIDVGENEFVSLDDGSVNHITGVVSAIVDLSGQNVSALQDNLGGAVLTRLGSGDFSNLAGVALDHDEGADLESGSISLLGLRGTGFGDLELFVFLITHALYMQYKNKYYLLWSAYKAPFELKFHDHAVISLAHLLAHLFHVVYLIIH